MDALYPTISLGGDLLNWENISAQVGKVCSKILSIPVNLLGGKKRKKILFIGTASLVIAFDPGETNAMDVRQGQGQQVQQSQGTQHVQPPQGGAGYSDDCFVPRGFSHLDGDPGWKENLIKTLNSLDNETMTKQQATALFQQLSKLDKRQRKEIVEMLSKNGKYAIEIKRMLELLCDIPLGNSNGLIVDIRGSRVGIETIYVDGDEDFVQILKVTSNGYITTNTIKKNNKFVTKKVIYYVVGLNKENELIILKVVRKPVKVPRK